MPLGTKAALTSRDIARRSRLLPVLLLINLAVAAVLAALVYGVNGSARQAYEAQAYDTAQNVAAMAQANIASEFSRVDAVMQAALSELGYMRQGSGRKLDDAALNSMLESHWRLLQQVEGLRMSDSEGRVRWGNDLPTGPGIDVSDRDYFIRARAEPQRGADVSGPLVSRLSGHWLLVLARPVLKADGSFDGVIYASIAVDHFQQLFAGYAVGQQDAVTLRTRNLRLVARHAPGSSAPVAVGSAKVSEDLLAALGRNPVHGTVVTRTALDQIERISAYREVDGWPLIVLAGLGSERFFTAWHAQTHRVALLAGVAWLLFLGASAAIYRAGRGQLKSVRELTAQTRRAQTLLRVSGDGIHVLDRRGMLVEMNEAFAQMLGSTREQLMGRELGSWVTRKNQQSVQQWLGRLKDGDRQRLEAVYKRNDGRLLDVELQVSAAQIDGELFIYGAARDITERKRLLASIEEQSARIQDLYDQAPCGYHSVNSDGVIVHVNRTLLEWIGATAEEVIGRCKVTDFVDAEGRALVEREFPRIKQEGYIDNVEVRLAPRRGRPPRVLRVSVTSIRDAEGNFMLSRSVSQDVTLEHEAQQQINQLLSEQSAMLDNEILGMAKLRKRTFLWKNRALDRIFGYAPGELDGQPIRQLYADDASFEDVGAGAYPLLATGQHYRTQVQMRHKQGHLLWIDLSSFKLSEELSLWTMADITAVKEAQARAEHIAFHDLLTGLPNRLLLADRMRQAVLSAGRSGKQVAVCYLDLDGFKAVNDKYGHDSGDELLGEISQRIETQLRAEDTAARVGGDEFVVLLTQLASEGDWRPVLERVMAAIHAPVLLDCGATVHVGVSIGVALALEHSSDAGELLTLADQAMLRAKRAGKGRIELAMTPSV